MDPFTISDNLSNRNLKTLDFLGNVVSSAFQQRTEALKFQADVESKIASSAQDMYKMEMDAHFKRLENERENKRLALESRRVQILEDAEKRKEEEQNFAELTGLMKFLQEQKEHDEKLGFDYARLDHDKDKLSADIENKKSVANQRSAELDVKIQLANRDDATKRWVSSLNNKTAVQIKEMGNEAAKEMQLSRAVAEKELAELKMGAELLSEEKKAQHVIALEELRGAQKLDNIRLSGDMQLLIQELEGDQKLSVQDLKGNQDMKRTSFTEDAKAELARLKIAAEALADDKKYEHEIALQELRGARSLDEIGKSKEGMALIKELKNSDNLNKYTFEQAVKSSVGKFQSLQRFLSESNKKEIADGKLALDMDKASHNQAMDRVSAINKAFENKKKLEVAQGLADSLIKYRAGSLEVKQAESTMKAMKISLMAANNLANQETDRMKSSFASAGSFLKAQMTHDIQRLGLLEKKRENAIKRNGGDVSYGLLQSSGMIEAGSDGVTSIDDEISNLASKIDSDSRKIASFTYAAASFNLADRSHFQTAIQDLQSVLQESGGNGADGFIQSATNPGGAARQATEADKPVAPIDYSAKLPTLIQKVTATARSQQGNKDFDPASISSAVGLAISKITDPDKRELASKSVIDAARNSDMDFLKSAQYMIYNSVMSGGERTPATIAALEKKTNSANAVSGALGVESQYDEMQAEEDTLVASYRSISKDERPNKNYDDYLEWSKDKRQFTAEKKAAAPGLSNARGLGAGAQVSPGESLRDKISNFSDGSRTDILSSAGIARGSEEYDTLDRIANNEQFKAALQSMVDKKATLPPIVNYSRNELRRALSGDDKDSSGIIEISNAIRIIKNRFVDRESILSPSVLLSPIRQTIAIGPLFDDLNSGRLDEIKSKVTEGINPDKDEIEWLYRFFANVKQAYPNG
jgi:hypothetical protein